MKETTSWGTVADWYHDHVSENDTYHSRVIVPNLIRLGNLKGGEHVLDLACGEGMVSRALYEAAKGKVKITGIDISPELIALAKKNSPKEISFHASAAHTLSVLKDGSVNVTLIVLAIQNIAEVKEVINEVKRVLMPGGRLLVVMNHPAYRIPKASSWEFDEKNKTQYRRIDAYMSERKESMLMHPGKSTEATISFHRPLQYYFKHLGNSGFSVTRLEEWISDKKSRTGTRSKEEDRMRHEIPLFLCLEAKK